MLLLALLATLLVKGLPYLALLWGIVCMAYLIDSGFLAMNRAYRPRQARPIFRAVILQIGRLTIWTGVQYA